MILFLAVVLSILVWGISQRTNLFSKASQDNLIIGFGNALEFQNTNVNDTFAKATSAVSLAKFPFTLETWIKIPQLPSGNYPIISYGKYTGTFGESPIWELNINQDNLEPEPYMKIAFADNPNYPDIINIGTTGLFHVNEWNHLVVQGSVETGGSCHMYIYYKWTICWL